MKKVILDVDTGIDDALGILLATKSGTSWMLQRLLPYAVMYRLNRQH